MHDLSDDPAAIARAAAAARSALVHYQGMARALVELMNVSENATFLVLPENGEHKVMRVHRQGYHSEAEIASELAWASALARAEGVRTPAALPNRQGGLRLPRVGGHPISPI